MTKHEILRQMREAEEVLGRLWWDLKTARKAETDDDLFMELEVAEKTAWDASCLISSYADDLERNIKNERVA